MSDISNLKLDTTIDTPLYQQLADKISELIEIGSLEPNTKLPPIRTLATALNVNNVTVINAYKLLEKKNIVFSKIGSGTYVSELDINLSPEPITRQRINQTKITKLNIPNAINFANTSVSEELFPVNEFKNIFNIVLDRDRGNAFSYQDSKGYEPLRIALCDHLEKRGVKTTPDRLQIISGAQQGIDIISKVMLSSNDTVFVEKPTYYGAVGAILSRGAQIIEIPLEADGINIDILKKLLNKYSPKFIYTMPYFQTPTCISYSLKKKRELLELAYKHNFYIIEEDNLSDFNYSKTATINLKSLDYKNKVIYIKSFSKILMPGLRIGYMVLPKIISENVLSAKYSTDIATSGFIQRAFELYIKSSDWDKHVATMRNIFNKKYNLILSLVISELSEYVDTVPPNGGLGLWLKIKTPEITATTLYNELIKNSVIITNGNLYSLSTNEESQYFRLNFAHLPNEDIIKGIAIISRVFSTLYNK